MVAMMAIIATIEVATRAAHVDVVTADLRVEVREEDTQPGLNSSVEFAVLKCAGLHCLAVVPTSHVMMILFPGRHLADRYALKRSS